MVSFGMRDLCKLNTLWVLANIAFTALLLVQLANILEGYIHPQTRHTWEKKEPLQNIEFPLVIKICVKPAFNQTALKEVGYKDTFSYIVGVNDSDSYSQIYGWAGHTEGSKTFGTVEEVLSKVVFKKRDIVQNIYATVKPAELIAIPLEYLSGLKLHFPQTCHSLVLSEIPALKGKAIQNVLFYFGELGNSTIEVQLKGRNLDCRRHIQEHSFYSTGDTIYLRGENMSKTYVVQISQRKHIEADPKGHCKDYPNQDYASYEECDSQFVKNMLPGLTPIWMADDCSKVTRKVVDQNWTYSVNGEVPLKYFYVYQVLISLIVRYHIRLG